MTEFSGVVRKKIRHEQYSYTIHTYTCFSWGTTNRKPAGHTAIISVILRKAANRKLSLVEFRILECKENSEKSEWLAHMNSLTASRCHIKAYQDTANQPPKWMYWRWNNNNMISNVRRTQKKSEAQMGFEPTTLRDLVGCSNHWATGDSMVSKGQFVGLGWNQSLGFFRVLLTFDIMLLLFHL